MEKRKIFLVIPLLNLTREDLRGISYSKVMRWYEEGKLHWYSETTVAVHHVPEGCQQFEVEHSY